MSATPRLSAAQLRNAAEIQTKIEALQAELAKVLNGTSAPAKKRTRSAAGRARIGAAARPTTARAVATVPPKKGRISPAGLRRIAAASKARWAKAKAAGKTKL